MLVKRQIGNDSDCSRGPHREYIEIQNLIVLEVGREGWMQRAVFVNEEEKNFAVQNDERSSQGAGAKIYSAPEKSIP